MERFFMERFDGAFLMERFDGALLMERFDGAFDWTFDRALITPSSLVS